MKNQIIGMLSYPSGRRHFNISNENEMPLQARALAWCMNITGMEALFTREDLFEFLVRLFTAIPELRAEEHFIEGEYLFEFHWEGMPYRMYPEDLVACLGLHIWDLPDNNLSREKWLQNLPAYRKSAWISSSLFRQTLNPVHSGEQAAYVSGPEVSAEALRAKESLANYLLACMDEEAFRSFERECGPELAALQEKVASVNRGLPASFDWEALAPDVKDAFMRHCMGEYYQETIPEEEEEDWAFIQDLAHLVWGVNNGLVRDLNTLHIDPRWGLDISRYEDIGLEGPGINLQITWNAYSLDDVKYLIKREIPETMEWEWQDFSEPDSVDLDIDDDDS